jgi:hypothetical protein
MASSRTLVAVNAIVVQDDIFLEGGDDADSFTVASVVLADWEGHQAYARSVLQEAIVLDILQEQETSALPEAYGIVVVPPVLLSGQASLLRPPKHWRPWPAEYRARFAMLAEALMEQEERLFASQKSPRLVRGGDSFIGGYASAYALQKLNAQAGRLRNMRSNLEAATTLSPGTELERKFRQLEGELRCCWTPTKPSDFIGPYEVVNAGRPQKGPYEVVNDGRPQKGPDEVVNDGRPQKQTNIDPNEANCSCLIL